MEYKFLNKISSPNDIKTFSDNEITVLCDEIRDYLIKTVSKTGGHLASNLGVVELTVAIHKIFNSPQDKILFDVGHQSYVHKILTGRYKSFETLRKENGISGFMRPEENEHDPFVTGHSSNSVSASFGIYKGTQISKNETNYSVSIVGDGAMTGGLLFEGLNNAGMDKNSSMIVVLNDNKMSISRNVGAFARYLSIISSKPGYFRFKRGLETFLAHIPLIGKKINRNLLRSKNMLKNAIYHSNIFEDMGFHYLGPIDGHNISRLEQALKSAKEQKRPVLVHVLTKKGKGYFPAESAPNNYHGVSAFDIEKGADVAQKADFSAAMGDELCRLAANDSKLCVITAAMTEGTGLVNFAEKYFKRFFDVGIAEEHAVTFSAGLAAGGAHPVFCVYSSFLQRAYDQMIHDVAISKLPVTICVDRAGIVGEDGETHQGVFDIAFLKTVPGIKIFSPSNYLELKLMLNRSIYEENGVCAIRYPRGSQPELPADYKFSNENFDFYGDPSSKVVLITFGRTFSAATKCYEKLKTEGIGIAVLKLNQVFPVDIKVFECLRKFSSIFIFEEGIRSGGINETICSGIVQNGIETAVKVIAIDNEFIPHMKVEDALKKLCLDSDSMCKIIKEGIYEK